MIAFLGVFLALALILSYVESLIPFYFGIPGVKLGLTNLIVVVMLYLCGTKEAFAISMLRIMLSGFLFGNMFSILYSAAGGLLSFLVMYALKHYFDEIEYIDILDCNGGDHGYPFATNFNPEINLREVSANGSYWEDGHWVEVEPMSIKREYDFPQVGEKDMYLLHHEEIESLAKNVPGVKRIRHLCLSIFNG